MTTTAAPPESVPELAPTQVDDSTPLRTVRTTNFPTPLRQLGTALPVTTYQAGKLVVVGDEGDRINTHSRALRAPWAWR
jgi:hypothetical protein